jgi:hypothetical protein
MKTPLVLAVLLLTASALGQQGLINGIAIDRDGQPVKGIALTAWNTAPRELQGPEPNALTNQHGEYRFEHLPLGTYVVCADDQRAGYALYTCARQNPAATVTLTVEKPEGEVRVDLPQQDGFLEIHVINQESGGPVPALRVEAEWENELRLKIKATWHENHVVLLPPDTEVMMHVSAPGFRAWEDDAGTGKLIYLRPGAKVKLDVQLTALME